MVPGGTHEASRLRVGNRTADIIRHIARALRRAHRPDVVRRLRHAPGARPRGPAGAGHGAGYRATRARVVAGAVGIALAPSALGILLLWAASTLGSRDAVVWAAAQAALLCGAGIAYLLWRLWTPTTATSGTRGLNLARVDSLTSRAAAAETTNRLHEETLHEVRATVAGLVTAAQLLGHPDSLDTTTRTRLQTMFDSELGRLQRIVSQRRSHQTETVDLDAAITPVVEALRTRGHAVRWVPTGQRVRGCTDDTPRWSTSCWRTPPTTPAARSSAWT